MSTIGYLLHSVLVLLDVMNNFSYSPLSPSAYRAEWVGTVFVNCQVV